MKRLNLLVLIILHSLLAIITILTNTIIFDMIFMSFTFIVIVKLLCLARYFLFDFVREKGEY